MIALRQLALQRGGKLLFQHVTLTLHPGWKVGVVGANGCGKSSLLALLRGVLLPDAGELEIPERWVIAHVAQESPTLSVPALEWVMDGDAELRRIERDLHAAEAAQNGARQAELHAQLAAIDGYRARARASKLMAGLGFTSEDLAKPITEFSGGGRARLNLAHALMCRSDVLLLDEPTNHLDLDAVLWLEQWLKTYPGTLLLISHDREVLDGVVDHVVHIDQQRIMLYTGNYTEFETQRTARLALHRAAYERQQQEIARLQRFIARFRAKATKARQVQSRIKALERMERIAIAHVDSPFFFRFAPPDHLLHPLLTVERAAAGYGEHVVLESLHLIVYPGMRLGVLGRNGAGKSTFIKLLAGILPPLRGRVHQGQGLKIGYFAQHQLERLRPEWSPLRHLQASGEPASDQELRDFLGGFGFSGDQALEPIASFSGGEKARLALALLVWRRPNLLLLDEPTNHLDLEMRHALTLALQGYQGAVVVVAHDRHLLRTVTDEFWLVAEGRIQPFNGDVDDYRNWLHEEQRKREPAPPAGRGNHCLSERRDRKRQEAERRQQLALRRRPFEQKIRQIEHRMEALHHEQKALDATLADPASYGESHKDRLKAILVRRGQVDQELAALETAWLELQETVDALTVGSG